MVIFLLEFILVCEPFAVPTLTPFTYNSIVDVEPLPIHLDDTIVQFKSKVPAVTDILVLLLPTALLCDFVILFNLQIPN